MVQRYTVFTQRDYSVILLAELLAFTYYERALKDVLLDLEGSGMEVTGVTATLTFFSAAFGAVAGASAQYYFTKHIEDRRHLRDLKSKAYMDYLRSVCEQAQLRLSQDPSKELQEVFTKAADAKARICLYGSNEVVQAFSQFETLGASMNSNDEREAFTRMVAIMRTDSGTEACSHAEDLQIVLLGSDRTRRRL